MFDFLKLSKMKLVLVDLKIYFQDFNDNNEWNKCIDQNSLTLGRCIHACDNDGNCENACLNQFKTRQSDCPCEVLYSLSNSPISNQPIQANCASGCPCDSTFCEGDSGDITTTAITSIATSPVSTTTTTAKSSVEAVLVLSGRQAPMIVDFDGKLIDRFSSSVVRIVSKVISTMNCHLNMATKREFHILVEQR